MGRSVLDSAKPKWSTCALRMLLTNKCCGIKKTMSACAYDVAAPPITSTLMPSCVSNYTRCDYVVCLNFVPICVLTVHPHVIRCVAALNLMPRIIATHFGTGVQSVAAPHVHKDSGCFDNEAMWNFRSRDNFVACWDSPTYRPTASLPQRKNFSMELLVIVRGHVDTGETAGTERTVLCAVGLLRPERDPLNRRLLHTHTHTRRRRVGCGVEETILLEISGSRSAQSTHQTSICSFLKRQFFGRDECLPSRYTVQHFETIL